VSPGSFDRACTGDLQLPLADLPILLVNRELRNFFKWPMRRKWLYLSVTDTRPKRANCSPNAPVYPHRVTPGAVTHLRESDLITMWMPTGSFPVADFAFSKQHVINANSNSN